MNVGMNLVSVKHPMSQLENVSWSKGTEIHLRVAGRCRSFKIEGGFIGHPGNRQGRRGGSSKDPKRLQ